MQFIKQIFATPMLLGVADCASVCSEAETLAYSLRKNLTHGRLVSDGWDVGAVSKNTEDFIKHGVTSFNSTEDLCYKPEWSNVSNFIYEFAKTMIDTVDTENVPFRILNMWTTIYPTGCWVPEHNHSNSHLSGVFYVKAPKNCGDIVFHDPSWVAKTMCINNSALSFPAVQTKHPQTPEPGMMILFPSWLPHRTMPNGSQEDRIIISFNLQFKNIFTENSNDNY